jgi:hypothetical protein
MVVAQDSLELDLGATHLTVVGGSHPSVTWSQDGGTGGIVARRTPAAMDLGIAPLGVGGDWTFTSPSNADRCVASLSPATWSGSCTDDVSGWPTEVTAPAPNVTYTAVRTQQVDSVFGDLGGVWTATDGKGGPGSCTVTFQGSAFSSVCNAAAGSLEGTVQLTFDGTSSASGTTSHGYELSAHKQ